MAALRLLPPFIEANSRFSIDTQEIRTFLYLWAKLFRLCLRAALPLSEVSNGSIVLIRGAESLLYCLDLTNE